MNKEEILAFLNGVSFEDDFVQVLSVRPEGTEIEFPLTKGPVNFSVMSDCGLSVRWGVTVERKGDVYIYDRDVKDAEKVSLHASGRQHIAVTPETAIRVGTSSRFGLRWTEPVFEQGALPAFSILFPPWGVKDMRPESLAKRKAELLIVGHVEKTVVVGFFVMKSERILQVNAPHFVIAKLPMGNQKTLHVVAWKESEKDLRTVLQAALEQTATPLPDIDDLILNFQGFRAPDSAFMVPVPLAALR